LVRLARVPTPAKNAKPDRREAITDAAIEILAEIGSRGLTHRAVDSRLDLAAGSTSYYFRTREALLRAAGDRMVELDRQDMSAALAGEKSATKLLERWLTPKLRSRLIARFELFVASTRQPEPQPLKAVRTTFIANVASVFEAAGVQPARAAAVTLIAAMEGLLLNEMLGTGLTPAERARALDAVLVGLTRKSTAGAPGSSKRQRG
jgi:AcrR family transcriptional regulator